MATKKEQQKKTIAEFSLMDDTFFTMCFRKNKKCLEYLISIILKKKLQLVEATVQDPVVKEDGRGVRFDVLAKDSKNRYYDIEIQRSNEGAIPRRARYNAAHLDASHKKKNSGLYGKNLPETYIIFITENDYWKKGDAVYAFERKCTASDNTELLFDDGLHIIYVNGQYRGKDKIGTLMRDMSSRDIDDMSNSILKDQVRYFKENEQGVNNMCKVMNKLIKEERKEEKKRIAQNMLNMGMSVKDIAKATGLSEKDINNLKKSA